MNTDTKPIYTWDAKPSCNLTAAYIGACKSVSKLTQKTANTVEEAAVACSEPMETIYEPN